MTCITKLLQKKCSGNLICYSTSTRNVEPCSLALYSLQAWDLPIRPTLQICVAKGTEQSLYQQLYDQADKVILPWLQNYLGEGKTFSVLLQKGRKDASFTVNTIGLSPEAVSSTENLLTQQIYWLKLYSLLEAYGTNILQIAPKQFERIKAGQKQYEGAHLDFDLSNQALQELVYKTQKEIENAQGSPFSFDPKVCLTAVVRHAIHSLVSSCRQSHLGQSGQYPETLRITVQAQTLTSHPGECADILLYSKDPVSNKKEWTGEFYQGYEQVLSSVYSIHPFSIATRLRYGYQAESFEEIDLASYRCLQKLLEKVPPAKEGYWKLTAHYSEEGITFSGICPVSPPPAQNFSIPLSKWQKGAEGARIPALCVSPGFAKGILVLSINYAKECIENNTPCILVTDASSNLWTIPYCAGVLLTSGGITSSTAEVARKAHIPALLKGKALLILSEKKELYLGGHKLKEGDLITLDADSHAIILSPEEIVSRR